MGFIYIYRGYIGIMEKNMESTIMGYWGYIGLRVFSLARAFGWG